MADKVYFLNEDDRDRLKEIYDFVKGQIPAVNPTQRAKVETPDIPSTAVYIAYALSGIPAMTGSPGTGSGSMMLPGSAFCNIWRIAQLLVGTGNAMHPVHELVR